MTTAKKKPHEIVKVDANCDQVLCNGGNGPLGHPQVWYSFDGQDQNNCFYCGRLFIKEQAKTNQ